MEASDTDKIRLANMFPDLIFDKNFIKGTLSFAAKFLEDQKMYELFDPKDIAPIKGSFQIFIDFSKQNPYREVYETNGEIKKIADRLQKTLLDLHAKEKNGHINVCVAGYLQERQAIPLVEFICEIVTPYFCDLIVFEKDGYWPRGEYAHGALGILENYSDQLALTDDIAGLTEQCINELAEQGKDFEYLRQFLLLKKKLKGSWTGLNQKDPAKKFRDIIGKKAFDGLWRLKDNLKKYNLLSKIQS